MSNPSLEHFKALNRVWAYLNSTFQYSLNISFPKNQSKFDLIGYTDSDWGGDLSTRRSTTGYINTIQIDDESIPISWNSKLQKTVALSSCEAEYIAYKESIKESISLNTLLNELPTDIRELFKEIKTLYTDSESAIKLVKNPIFHSRTKYIDI